jgi:hypothetical protein
MRVGLRAPPRGPGLISAAASRQNPSVALICDLSIAAELVRLRGRFQRCCRNPLLKKPKVEDENDDPPSTLPVSHTPERHLHRAPRDRSPSQSRKPSLDTV